MNYWKYLKKPFFGRFRVNWQWNESFGDISMWEKVEFHSKSGALIKGIFGNSLSSKVKGNIVCSHPMVTSAKGFFIRNGHAEMLRKNGFNILLFDFNGFGESGDGDYRLAEDILAAGNFMAKFSPKYKVGFYGVSFGGALGICACSNADQPYISAVFESPFTTLEEFWSRWFITKYWLKLGYILFPKAMSEMRPIDRIKDIGSLKKILFISGDKDKMIPTEMGNRLKTASPISSDYWIVSGAAHTRCYTTAPEEFETRVIKFFTDTLK
jgi:fermentation-respiration switch protein FrsA (DUF1100 family)